jgi:hypothetical protein
MDAQRNQSEGLEIRLPDAAGMYQPAAHVNYTIRPGQGFNINLDVFNAELVEANAVDVKTAVNAFMQDAISKAATLGFPVGE